MCLGIPGQIVAVAGDGMLATVEIAGTRRQVNVMCVADPAQPPEALLGVWVLVHVGFAMSRIDEKDAAETLALLREIGEAQAELDAMRQSAAGQ